MNQVKLTEKHLYDNINMKTLKWLHKSSKINIETFI